MLKIYLNGFLMLVVFMINRFMRFLVFHSILELVIQDGYY